MFDDQIRQIGFHDDLPSPRRLKAVRVDKNRESATDDDESEEDDLAKSGERTFPTEKSINEPAIQAKTNVPSPPRRPPCRFVQTMEIGMSHKSPRIPIRPISKSQRSPNIIAMKTMVAMCGRT